ncbi:PREDICTED: 60S ribosomal protein L28-like [Elephantulus edwardii]|uniref:60S ribosomal protein L28-like n=1 Tax=Elephantulus edwardii TaxID=28737 RepID=UPI0003F0C5A6|nr:PREDICTED: 60S ribosomal protein L28-like [Elephantulus edwardii]
MSAHLQWMVVCNCSSFLIKRNKQTYSTEPSNLKACNSFHYSQLIHRKTLRVEPAPDNKRVVVVMKWRSGQRKPATSHMWTTIHKNGRATLSSIRHMIHKNKYRPNLCMATSRRASATLRGQKKPVMVKGKRTRPTKHADPPSRGGPPAGQGPPSPWLSASIPTPGLPLCATALGPDKESCENWDWTQPTWDAAVLVWGSHSRA